MNFTEHTKIRKEKFGTVIFDTLTEKIFVTDQLGTEILGLIEQGVEQGEIVSILAEGYDGGVELIEKDINEFIEKLKRDKIISL
ncbi:MAG: PqqD family protein [Planctomycetota bacterium]|jgi:transcriptional regulator